MSPLRRLFVAVLALAGALSWGPPAVLALCTGGGKCRAAVEAPSCCRKAPAEGPSLAADGEKCCGCCATVRVGLGIDGPPIRVETPVPPPSPAPFALVAAPAATDAFVVPAAPSRPRAPPERVLPLRI